GRRDRWGRGPGRRRGGRHLARAAGARVGGAGPLRPDTRVDARDRPGAPWLLCAGVGHRRPHLDVPVPHPARARAPRCRPRPRRCRCPLDAATVPGGARMSELAVAAAWAVVVAGAGWRRRPAPARVRALGRERTAPKLVGPSRRPPVELLGCWLLGRMGRPPDPLTGRRVGGAVLAAAAVVPVLPFAVPAPALLGWSLPVGGGRR